MKYTFADFELDDRTCQLQGPDGIVALEPRAFNILLLLVRNSGRVVTKGELYREVWSNRVVSEASLSVAMVGLRRALGDDGKSPRIIATHRSRGYRLIRPVAKVLEDNSEPTCQALRRVPFVGRGRELRLVLEAGGKASREGLTFVALGGEAGIGKTSLLREALGQFSAEHYSTVLATCSGDGGAPAFWPWAQILGRILGELSPESLRTSTSGLEAIFDLLPELSIHVARSVRTSRSDSWTARARVFDAVSGFLDRASRRTPIVIAIDDLHCADEASLRLLQHLSHAVPDAPLAVLVAYRFSPLNEQLQRTITEVARHGSAQVIELNGLPTSDSTQLLRAISGVFVEEGAAKELHERSGGNPLFLTHLARLMDSDGSVDLASAPRDLVAALTPRLDTLSQPARALVWTAAVAGAHSFRTLLSAVLDLSPGEFDSAVREAASSEILVEPTGLDVLQFRHELVRDVVYLAVPDRRRMELHAKIADALSTTYDESRGPHGSWIAHHYFEARTICPEKAFAAARREAERAAAVFAYEESAHQFSRALTCLDLKATVDESVRASLLIALGTQLTRAGDRTGARRLFQTAIGNAFASASSSLLTEAALSIAPGVLALESGVVDAFLVEILEEAISRLSECDFSKRAQLLARLSLALHWSDSHRTPEAAGEEALDCAQRSGDAEAKAAALQSAWSLAHGPDHHERRTEIARLLASPSCRGASAETRLVSHVFSLYSALECGSINDVRNYSSRFKTLAERLRQPQGLWYAEMLQGMQALMRGDLQAAECHLERFAELGRRASDANAIHSALAHSAYMAFERDNLAAVIPGALRVAAEFPSVRVWSAALAWMNAHAGDLDSASAALRVLLIDGPLGTARRMDLNGTLCLAAEAAALVRDCSAAASLYTSLLPMRECLVVHGLGTLCWGSAERPLGLLAEALGDTRCATEHLEAAIRANERARAMPWAAHCHFELARVLTTARTHDDRRIAAHLRVASEIADSSGLIYLGRRLRALEPV